MRHKAVVPKAQWKQCRRPPQDGVASAFITRRHQYRPLGRSVLVNLTNILSFNQGDVRRNYKRRFHASRDTHLGGHCNGVALADVRIITNDLKPVLAGKIESKGIAGHQRDVIRAKLCNRVKHIGQHRLRELGSRRRIQ